MSSNNTQAQSNSSQDSNLSEDEFEFEEVELDSGTVETGGSVKVEAEGLEPTDELEPEETEAEAESVEEEEEASDEEPKKVETFTQEAFETFLQENYGITGELLKSGLQFFEQSQSEIVTYSYAQAWGVSMPEADQRIEKVLDYIETLPEAEQKKYLESGTAQDTMEIWDKIAQKSQAKRQYVKAAGAGSSRKVDKGYDYTESEIDAMDDATRRKHDARILKAYQQGRVRQ